MRYASLFLIALLAGAPLGAQPEETIGPEIRAFVGSFIPTGPHRQDFKAAPMAGGQVAIELSSILHIVSSLAWTHGHTRFAGFSNDLTHIWQYDAGVEVNGLYDNGNSWLLRPFVGVGAGARTYDYIARNVSTNTCLAGYGSLGAELQRSFVALRLEGRDFVTCFESPVTGNKRTRNDVGITFGLAYHFH